MHDQCLNANPGGKKIYLFLNFIWGEGAHDTINPTQHFARTLQNSGAIWRIYV